MTHSNDATTEHGIEVDLDPEYVEQRTRRREVAEDVEALRLLRADRRRR